MEYKNLTEGLRPAEILLYLRKSRQDNPDESVQEVLIKHERILQDFAEKTWGEAIPPANVYREVVSGETIDDRPMMLQVLQLMELPQYKAVLVVEPQRLSRGDLEDCGRMVNTIRYTNTLVITPSKTYDLKDKFDRKFFEMELMRGNDFLEYIKEIMGRGRVAAVMRGCFVSSVPPYGWQRCKIGKDYSLEPNPTEFPLLLLMYRFYVNDNNGFHSIAMNLDSMGVTPRGGSDNWSPAAIRDIIHNPVNDGMVRWGYRATKKIMVEGQLVKFRPDAKSTSEYILIKGLHYPHVPQELHDLYSAAQDKRGRTTRKKSSTKVRNPLAGLLRCQCGRMMSYRTYKKNGAERSAPRLLCDNQHNCHTRSVLYSDMTSAIIEVLKSHISDFKVNLKNESANSVELQQSLILGLKGELKQLEIKDEKQKDLLEDGLYTKEDFIKRNAALQQRIQNVKTSIREAEENIPPAIDYKDKIKKFSKAVKMLEDDTSDPAELNKLLKNIIEKIEYSNEISTTRKAGETKQLQGGWLDNQFNINVFLRL